MNRFVFGRGWVYQEEADDGTKGGAGSDDAGVDDGAAGDDAGGDAGAAGAGAAGAKAAEQPGAKTQEGAPKDMKSAIDAALGYKKGPNGEALDPLTGKAKEEKPAAPAKPPTDGKESDTHFANGKPKKDATGQALDDKGQVVKQAPAKPKTAAELALKPEEMKGLHAKTSARFGEVITALKAHEATIAKQTQDIKVLGEARDTILGVMEEVNLSSEQFSNYLEFHGLLQSKNPKDLEQALTMIEEQRAALYKVLGREPAGGGIDLLAEFPDLKKQVDDEEITRQAALEIAHGRRDRAARTAAENKQQNTQRTQQQTVAQRKQESESALGGIEKWTAEVSKSDLDYKAKEDILLPQIAEIMKEYEPKLWLPTIKRLYAGITVQKAVAQTGGDKKPLRPSAARPGAKQAASMQEAIDQGLGYATAEKG